MGAAEAARLGDEIGHSSAMAGLITGVLVGLAAAAAVVAIVGTGGLAAVAIGAGIAAAGAAGGLSGAYIGELIEGSPTGAVQSGSTNVVIGSQPAARAEADIGNCSKHHSPVIAEGSSTVSVNSFPASRKGDKLECGAKIRKGMKTVLIGGETVQTREIASEIPGWLTATLWVVMIAGTIIATGGAALVIGVGPALGALAGGLVGSAVLGWVGGKAGRYIGGLLGNAELGARIGEVVGSTIGGLFGAKVGAKIGARVSPGSVRAARIRVRAKNMKELRAARVKFRADMEKHLGTDHPLMKNVNALEQDGWKFRYSTRQDGRGTYCDRQGKHIIINKSDNFTAKGKASALAHEVGHANYNENTYHPTSDFTTKPDYVKANVNECMRDEGAAIQNEAQYYSSNPDKFTKPSSKVMDSYNDAMSKGPLDQTGTNQLRDDLGDTYRKAHPSTKPWSNYEKYYGQGYADHWDKTVPAGGGTP
jgi:uncharacterized Zn-binding protein involved in type VI secretion